MADANKPSMWHINHKLLPVKAVYFTFLAGIGDLLPFITVYMKQLGLSSIETGIIYGVMPFIAFFVRPLFGIIADKTRKHRMILILCCVMTGVSYCLLLLTPEKIHANGRVMTSVRTEITCNKIDSFIKDCEAAQDTNNTFNSENIQICDKSLGRFAAQALVNTTNVECKATCGVSFSSRHMHVCFTNDIGTYDRDKCGAVWNLSETKPEFDFTISDLAAVVKNKVIGQNYTYQGKVCQNYDLKNVSFQGEAFWQFLCDAESFFECQITCESQYHHTCISFAPKLSQTFWVFFVIFFFCNIFFSPVLSLIDAMAYDILGNEKSRQWGRQRFWGTVGFSIFAIASTFIMDSLKKSNQEVDYSVSFYIFLGLNILTGVLAYFLQFSDMMVCSQVFKNITQLVKYPEVVIFLIIVFILGIFNSVPEAFLFWYLLNLGSSQIILGLCLVFNGVPELIMFQFAGKVIKKIGHVYCLYISFLAYAVRFLSYSFLTNPWYVLLIEPIHCLNFALMYSAASGYASIITPQGMSATVQGLIGGIFFGLGKGVGSLLTGKLFDPVSGLGEVWTFRFHAIFALVVLVVYAMIQTIFFGRKNSSSQSVPQDEKSDEQDEDSATADGMLLSGNSVSNDNADLAE